MILVGQYDSPFVRRVAVALHHYGLKFERRVLSVFADFDAMLTINTLGKVPSLVLDDGEVLFDSRAIIDYLDGIAPAERRLAPVAEPARHRVLRIEAVAIGLAEKAYERGIEFARRAPGTQDPAWVARVEHQIASAAGWLDALAPSPWMIGDRLSRADLAAAVALTYLHEKQPHLVEGRYALLDAHRRRCEALPAFRAAPYSASEAKATSGRPEAGQK